MASTGPESDSPSLQYLRSYGLHETPEQARLREETAQMPNGHWASTPEQAALMQQVIRLSDARQVLEIGTFTGCMTLAMALALGEGGRIITCDAASGWSEMGEHFWRAARVDGFIERRIGRADEVLEGLLREGERGKFDLVFLDADIGRYDAYLNPITALLRPGGVLVAGGVLGDGRVADAGDDDPEIASLCTFNRHLHDGNGYDLAMLPVGDGLTLAIKKQ